MQKPRSSGAPHTNKNLKMARRTIGTAPASGTNVINAQNVIINYQKGGGDSNFMRGRKPNTNSCEIDRFSSGNRVVETFGDQ